MSSKVKAFVESLNWNQKVNITLLALGFAILAWKLGILVSIGFTCLAIYSRPDY